MTEEKYVTTGQCKEYREICSDARKTERDICGKAGDSERDSRDAWITKIERKIDWLIGIIVVQTIGFSIGLLYLILSHLLGGV